MSQPQSTSEVPRFPLYMLPPMRMNRAEARDFLRHDLYDWLRIVNACHIELKHETAAMLGIDVAKVAEAAAEVLEMPGSETEAIIAVERAYGPREPDYQRGAYLLADVLSAMDATLDGSPDPIERPQFSLLGLLAEELRVRLGALTPGSPLDDGVALEAA